MALADTARDVVGRLAKSEEVSDVIAAAAEQFSIDPSDFLSARERGETAGTRLITASVPLHEVAHVVHRSHMESGGDGQTTNVIAPVVIPEQRTFLALLPAGLLAIVGLVGTLFSAGIEAAANTDGIVARFFGPHFWLLVVLYAVFLWWRRSLVAVPDGCQALITRFGKLENVAGPGRTLLLSPWKRVSYVVNTTREYPYNAPIRQAPTQSGVQASVDLFLQFRIEDPAGFIFSLGSVHGFSDKLQNAISEVTRALIYEQRAEDIYDLVGESTQALLQSLNDQFQPAVVFTNANITHAEPSSQDYRMDLAAPEMVRVAKEAYTYQYELELQKQQNEGELDRELATLRETLSAIRADIATYQAQIDTALERETHRANSQARQMLVEAESQANANAALLEAQALDLRAVSSASAPEILEYRFEEEVLDRLAGIADRLPQLVRLGADEDQAGIDYLAIARELVGRSEANLFTSEELEGIRSRLGEINGRIADRQDDIEELLASQDEQADEVAQPPRPSEVPGEDQVEKLRRSVADVKVVPDGQPSTGDRGARTAGSTGGADPDDHPDSPDAPAPGPEPDADGSVADSSVADGSVLAPPAPDMARPPGPPPQSSPVEDRPDDQAGENR